MYECQVRNLPMHLLSTELLHTTLKLIFTLRHLRQYTLYSCRAYVFLLQTGCLTFDCCRLCWWQIL